MTRSTALAAVLAPASSSASASAHDAGTRLRARGRATGALVVTGFGTLWAGAGLLGAGAPAWSWLVLCVLATALAANAIRILRTTPPVDAAALPAELAARRRRGDRIFRWAVAGEGVGILLAVNVVSNLGHPQWQPAAAMLVVGLHFLPLASGFGSRSHLATGVALSAWALAYPGLLAAGAMAPAGWLVAGAILMASALVSLRSVARAA